MVSNLKLDPIQSIWHPGYARAGSPRSVRAQLKSRPVALRPPAPEVFVPALAACRLHTLKPLRRPRSPGVEAAAKLALQLQHSLWADQGSDVRLSLRSDHIVAQRRAYGVPIVAVLVTGGAGFIGSHLVFGLIDSGEEVVVLDDLSSGFRSAVAQQAAFVKGDVGDCELVQNLIRTHSIDSVIHCAGAIDVAESVKSPLHYYKNNTFNSCVLIECCIKTGVANFIFSSTAAVYGDPKTIPVDEQAPLLPISPYGSSKLLTEVILRDAALAHPLRYVVLRYFNVAGADPEGRAGQSTTNATHLVKVAVEVASGKRSQLEVYGNDYPTPDGTCVRDYVHVADLVDAHLAALAYLREGSRSCILNCGYGHGSSVLEVISAVERALGNSIRVEFVGRRAGDPPALVAKADQIKRVLRWQPRYDNLETIVGHALLWERRRDFLKSPFVPNG